MAIQDRVFSLAKKVLQVISLKNVILWTVTALLAVVFYTIYEQRAQIINYIVNGPEDFAPQVTSFAVSDQSRNRIKQLVNDSDLIIAITVLNADIRNNRRIPIYWFADDPQVQKQLDTSFSGRYGGIPLFTSDEKNNETIVGVINGEFACAPYDSSGSTTVFPNLASRFPWVCRTSLPPYYGQFSGYIMISLNRQPSASELDYIKAESLNLSTEIYFRDVLPQNRKVSS